MEMSFGQEGHRRAEADVGAGNIIFRIASYNSTSLRRHTLMAAEALAFVANQLRESTCGNKTYLRMIELARLALVKLVACEVFSRAVQEWANVHECEAENTDREQRLVRAMDGLDVCIKEFGTFCENF